MSLAAYAIIDIIFNLSRQDVGVGALRGNNQRYTKSAALTGNGPQLANDCRRQLFLRLIHTRSVSDFSGFIHYYRNTVNACLWYGESSMLPHVV